MIKRTFFLFFIVLLAIGAGSTVLVRFLRQETGALVSERVMAEEPDRETHVAIHDGDTFGVITATQGLSPEDSASLLKASAEVYDFTTIRVGKTLVFVYDHESNRLERVVYEPDSESQVVVSKTDAGWTAEKRSIEYEMRLKTVSGTIESSLYETALSQNMDERAVIALAEVFAWQIDFAIDIRVGDTFTAQYEERYRDGAYVMPGRILAAKFMNDGTEFKGYYYKESDDNEGYFDTEGKSLQKIFLKSPLQYKYISSGFGKRIDPISRKASTHTGIDYAAPYGTPAVTVGAGTVVSAGWNGGYGLSVDVRHNETYTTRYGHFSQIAVKKGEQLEQGDIVGYVGSTGWSTGPHLHYEMHKNESQVDPFKVDIPSGKALQPESLPAFDEYIQHFSF